MKKQKVMSQIKEQEKLYEVEIGNLPGKEFRIMIVEDDPGYQENNDEVSRNVYQRHTRTKGQTEMNNTLERINSRITEIEAWVDDLEDRMVEITAAKQRNEDSLRDLWGNIKCTNTHIIGVPEEERGRTRENI